MDTQIENDGFDIDTVADLALLAFVAAIFGMAVYSICQMG